MKAIALLVACAAPLAGAWLAHERRSGREARHVAIVAMLVALMASLVALTAGAAGLTDTLDSALALVLPRPGWSSALPTFVAAIGLTAVAMSSLLDTRPHTFARTLAIVAASMALVLARHPIALALLWPATALPVWFELRASAQTRPTARLFATYLGPSSLLVALGAALSMAGASAMAALLIAAGIAIREATVPFHSWLPRVVERAPLAIVVAFVTPQLGAFVHVRFLSQGLPTEFADATAALGAVTMLFGAAMGVAQLRPRRALGYLMMSQTALVAFGLDARSPVGHAGALTAWLACGLATTGLAMSLAALEARRGPSSIATEGGSSARVPLLASAYLVLGLASVGLPGTLGFVAEDLLMHGAVESFPLFSLSLIAGTALNGAAVVRGFFALFTGSRRHDGERDLTLRERAALSVLLAALIGLGLFPARAVDWLDAGRDIPILDGRPRDNVTRRTHHARCRATRAAANLSPPRDATCP